MHCGSWSVFIWAGSATLVVVAPWVLVQSNSVAKFYLRPKSSLITLIFGVLSLAVSFLVSPKAAPVLMVVIFITPKTCGLACSPRRMVFNGVVYAQSSHYRFWYCFLSWQ